MRDEIIGKESERTRVEGVCDCVFHISGYKQD
jgi:hypothetical protein